MTHIRSPSLPQQQNKFSPVYSTAVTKRVNVNITLCVRVMCVCVCVYVCDVCVCVWRVCVCVCVCVCVRCRCDTHRKSDSPQDSTLSRRIFYLIVKHIHIYAHTQTQMYSHTLCVTNIASQTPTNISLCYVENSTWFSDKLKNIPTPYVTVKTWPSSRPTCLKVYFVESQIENVFSPPILL